jgi:regulator of protease activity HflC (stomatin/prohibitin superfamily)
MSLPATSLSAQELVSVPSAVIRQCAIDAAKADQYDDLRTECEKVREEVYGLRAMHKQVQEERDRLRLRVVELEGRWSASTWFALGAVTATAILLGALAATP